MDGFADVFVPLVSWYMVELGSSSSHVWLLAAAVEMIEPSVSSPPAKSRLLHLVVSTFQRAARKSQYQCSSIFKSLLSPLLLSSHWQVTELIRVRGNSVR